MNDKLSISVDSAAINEYIAQQIIESTLGERLRETVDQALKQLGGFGSDPLKAAVQDEVRSQVMTLVRTEFQAQIHAAVREKLTDELLEKLVESFMSGLTVRLDRY